MFNNITFKICLICNVCPPHLPLSWQSCSPLHLYIHLHIVLMTLKWNKIQFVCDYIVSTGKKQGLFHAWLL